MVEICLSEFNDRHKDIHILCFSETFVRANNEINICINDFTLATSYSRNKENRGGVCILIKHFLDYKIIRLCKEMAVEKVFECCGIEIPLYNCTIVCVYRTPNSNIHLFFNKLELLLHKLSDKKNNKIILVGDLNINTLTTNKNATVLNDILRNYNLTLKIKTPTRHTACIDHIITNMPDSSGETCELHLSDHNTAQILTFPSNASLNKPAPSHYFIYRRNYSQEHINKFKECLLSLSFQDIYDEMDPNTAFNNFHEIFSLFYKLNFPLQKVKVNYQTPTLKWVTKGIKNHTLNSTIIKIKP